MVKITPLLHSSQQALINELYTGQAVLAFQDKRSVSGIPAVIYPFVYIDFDSDSVILFIMLG